jgi:predicted aldo/keto reductase-like oxidoreductase
MLGLGTAPGGIGLKDDVAIALFERAIDLGITYIDTAPGYERAQKQLSEIVPAHREDIFLISKGATSDGDEMKRILEQNLRDLKTDQLDLMYVHSMGHQDVEQVLAPGGALAALEQAKEQGLIRYIGVTGHHMPWKVAKVLREAEIDIIMVALNFADHYTYNFDGEVLALAAANNVGVAAMKVYGGSIGMKYEQPVASALAPKGFSHYELALRYALGLPGVHLAVLGVYSEEELVQNIEWVHRYQPLTTEQERALLQRGQVIADEWGPHFGDVH